MLSMMHKIWYSTKCTTLNLSHFLSTIVLGIDKIISWLNTRKSFLFLLHPIFHLQSICNFSARCIFNNDDVNVSHCCFSFCGVDGIFQPQDMHLIQFSNQKNFLINLIACHVINIKGLLHMHDF